jgi:hypothetical protein
MAELKELTNDPEAREESAKEVNRFFKEITRGDTTWPIKMVIREIFNSLKWLVRKMLFKIKKKKENEGEKALKQNEIDALLKGVKEE